MGLDPNMYDVTLFTLFFIEGFPKLKNDDRMIDYVYGPEPSKI